MTAKSLSVQTTNQLVKKTPIDQNSGAAILKMARTRDQKGNSARMRKMVKVGTKRFE